MDKNLQPLTITLNGREVSGYPGMTILELANESGVYIPTLCNDEHLNPVGACRLCLVEDEKTGRLMASCVMPISAGMVINTDSTRVVEHRKNIIKLMLASHPENCLVCDKGNRCQLRTIAANLGVGLIGLERIPKVGEIREVNPFIERDLSKCVLCSKCIRACQELVVEGAIDYLNRGFVSKVATMDDMPLENSECTFCGTCVALCPTGALMEKDREYTGTVSSSVETTCPYCGCGCSISVEIKNGRIVRVRPGKEGVNNGTLCVRGSYGYGFVHSPDRLEKPLIKKEETLEEVSLEEVLEQTAGEFKRIKDRYGADSIAIIGSSKCTNEENYLLQRFTRCVLGTNNIDNGSRIYNAANGIPVSNSDLAVLEQSDVILVIGADPASSAPLVEYGVKRAVKSGKTKTILIDPRQTVLSFFAQLHLQPKPGTDVALLNGLAREIVSNGLPAEKGVDTKSGNYKEYIKILDKYTPEYVESVTGVGSGQIRDAARLLAGANKAAVVYGSGITQYKNSADAVKAIYNLAVLSGNAEGSVYALQRDSNARGANDSGVLPDYLPGYRSVTDAAERKQVEELWKCDLPEKPGLTALEIIEQAKAGNIKALWIVGENPVISFPDRSLVEEALSSLELLVVQDMFLSETAEMADVVLPAVSFAEKEGTFTNFEGRTGYLRKAVSSIGESLADSEIVLRLAEKMGSPLPYSDLQHVKDEMYKIVNIDGRSNGTAGLSIVEYIPETKDEKNGYRYTLLTGSYLNSFGSGSRSSRSNRLKNSNPGAFIEINRSDAETLGIENGDKLKVASPAGEITVTPRVSDTLPEGMLFIPVSFPEARVNRLFDNSYDQETKIPCFKTQMVSLERIKSDE